MKCKRPGFTVLEAAVALMIIGMSAVGVLSAFGMHTRIARRMQTQLEAAALAQHVIAKLRMLESSEFQPLADSISAGRFDPPFDSYTWTAEVSPVSGERGLYGLSVLIEHPEAAFNLATRRYVAPRQMMGR